MVTGRRHGTHAVIPSRQAPFHSGGQASLSVTGIVDTLEESELGCVRRCGGCEVVAECLDGDVCVTHNLATLECLRSGVIGGIGIGEGAGLQIRHLYVDVKVRVSGNLVAGCRIRDDGGYHVGGRGNVSHD